MATELKPSTDAPGAGDRVAAWRGCGGGSAPTSGPMAWPRRWSRAGRWLLGQPGLRLAVRAAAAAADRGAAGAGRGAWLRVVYRFLIARLFVPLGRSQHGGAARAALRPVPRQPADHGRAGRAARACRRVQPRDAGPHAPRRAGAGRPTSTWARSSTPAPLVRRISLAMALVVGAVGVRGRGAASAFGVWARRSLLLVRRAVAAHDAPAGRRASTSTGA